MKFALYVEQHGEGCDYTIGCGNKLLFLKATTREAAEEEAKQVLVGTVFEIYSEDAWDSPEEYLEAFDDHLYEGGFHGEERIEKAYLLALAPPNPIPVKAWYEEHAQIQALRKELALEIESEAAERAELERLKAKYPD